VGILTLRIFAYGCGRDCAAGGNVFLQGAAYERTEEG